MKIIKIILMMILFCTATIAQEFVVEKVSGEVKYQTGTSEEWNEVEKGKILNGNDVLLTEEKSFVQLNKDGSRFILQSNAALGLNHVEKVTINDLLLALAMEEIRNVPKNKGNGNTRNTAVYGAEVKENKQLNISVNDFGIKKLNGAKQLAENGFKESAVIVAKETYRKYPSTKNRIEERLFFADLLTELKLYDEAFAELTLISKLDLNDQNRKKVTDKIETVKMEMVNE